MHTAFKSIAVALALAAGSAQAAVVSQSQIQTTDGQAFTFSLAAPNYKANTASKLSLTVQGDFNGEPGEFVTVVVEGVNRGTFGAFSPEAYGVIDYRSGTDNFNALQFSLDFLLPGGATTGYLADGNLDLTVFFNYGVTVACGWSNAANCLPGVGSAPFARVDFDYATNAAAVPEPASLALFGLGMAGFAATRRRKAKSGR